MKNIIKYVVIIMACMALPAMAAYNAVIVSNESYRLKSGEAGTSLADYDVCHKFVKGEVVYLIASFKEGGSKKIMTAEQSTLRLYHSNVWESQGTSSLSEEAPFVSPATWDSSSCSTVNPNDETQAIKYKARANIEGKNVYAYTDHIQFYSVELITPVNTSTNKRYFRSYEDNGELTVAFIMLVRPELDTGDEPTFSMDPITGATKTLSNNGTMMYLPINGVNAYAGTVSFDKQPASNGDLGKKNFTVSIPALKYEFTNHTKIFVTPTGTAHPTGAGDAATPNWYYYWKQVLGWNDFDYESDSGTSAGDVTGSYSRSKDKLYLHDAAYKSSGTMTAIWHKAEERETHRQHDVGQATKYGIDTVRVTLVHERKHQSNWKAINKLSIDEQIAQDPDVDFVLTSIEDALGTDPNVRNSWTLSYGGDGEYSARKSEVGVELPETDPADWISGEYGKQWNGGSENLK